jgi:hypothetical protein
MIMAYLYLSTDLSEFLSLSCIPHGTSEGRYVFGDGFGFGYECGVYGKGYGGIFGDGFGNGDLYDNKLGTGDGCKLYYELF